MSLRLLSLLFLAFFLTGCTKQSTVVNINLPVNDENILENNNVVSNSNMDVSQGVTNTNNNTNTNTNTNTKEPVTEPVTVEIPNKLELDVAFASQAPFGNWNELHEEACEEASMVTAAKYFLNQPLTEKIMEEELVKLDAWEKNNGYKIDLSVTQTAAVLKDYFNLSAKVVTDVSVNRIKYELSLGNLVIVPAAGRELNNPYFRAPGPIYHMLVIKGYDSDEFIVNEVGTKRGDSFKYKYDVLINAIHDWNPDWSHYEVTDEQMTAQPKKMVVVNK